MNYYPDATLIDGCDFFRYGMRDRKEGIYWTKEDRGTSVFFEGYKYEVPLKDSVDIYGAEVLPWAPIIHICRERGVHGMSVDYSSTTETYVCHDCGEEDRGH